MLIQGYNPREEEKSSYLNPIEKTKYEISNNDVAKECLKYSYGIIYHILEVLVKSKEEVYLIILSPLLYYWIEHKSVLEYMYSTHKHLKEKLCHYHSKLRYLLELALEDRKEELENLKKFS
jgi:hypothetical protein